MALVRENVGAHRDADSWDLSTRMEEAEREVLTAASERWTDVKALLS